MLGRYSSNREKSSQDKRGSGKEQVTPNMDEVEMVLISGALAEQVSCTRSNIPYNILSGFIDLSNVSPLCSGFLGTSAKKIPSEN